MLHENQFKTRLHNYMLMETCICLLGHANLNCPGLSAAGVAGIKIIEIGFQKSEKISIISASFLDKS
jgi:hypothetical protein